jgi:hypothetical protein
MLTNLPVAAATLLTSLLGLGLVSLATVGCADPQGAQDEFVERDCKAKGEPFSEEGCVKQLAAGECEPPAAGEADGKYLLVLSAVIDATHPLIADGEIITAAGADGLEVTFTGTFLDSNDRMTPVGDEGTLGPWVVSGNGQFDSGEFDLNVDGGADPIIPGAPIVAKAQLKGTFCKDAAAEASNCGSLLGTVSAPAEVSLEGSTFKLMSSADGIPTDIVIDCEGNLADPAM